MDGVAVGEQAVPEPGTRLVVVGPGIPEEPSPGVDRGWLRDTARSILNAALEPAVRDDRFDSDWPPEGLTVAIELIEGRGAGYLGGATSRGRLQLDGLLVEPPGPPGTDDTAGADGSPDAGTDDTAADRAEALWLALGPAVLASDATVVELWGRPARPWHEALARRQGLTEARALHQLRCPLPVEVEVLPTRPFVPGEDEDALIEVNNRAFAAHPDQGGLTREALAEAEDQPWFEPDGVRLHDDPDRPGHLAGFCWTKIHEPIAPGEPRLGEIYAIGVDPSHHGRGLGGPMTGAGLRWLADRGLTTGMLYVEADNEPALRTYDRLGFRHHRTDRAWHRPIGR